MKDMQTQEMDFESYLYIITHDLKTFSRAMRVIPEWIEEDLSEAGMVLPKDVDDHVTMLRNYANGLDRMMDGLTELSRVGRLADAPSCCALRPALEAAWARVPEREGATLAIQGPEAVVLAPANDLDRLLFALLSNAVRHHRDGPCEVRVEMRLQGDRVFLSVADTGPGIADHDRERIFDPLFTLRPKDECKTAGMGLTVARKVVRTLDGELHALEPPDQRGALFECDLPAAE